MKIPCDISRCSGVSNIEQCIKREKCIHYLAIVSDCKYVSWISANKCIKNNYEFFIHRDKYIKG